MKPNTFPVQCIRCDKLTAGIHTCTPSKQYREGILEGLKIAYEVVQDARINCDAQEALQRDIDHEIDKLIKQYSGE